MDDQAKSWSLLAILVILLGLASGCVSSTEAAPGRQEHPSEQAGYPLAPESKPAQQENTKLLFAPSPGQTTVGNVAAVQLRIENAQNLFGLEVQIAFDPSVVQIEDDDAGRAGVQIAFGEIPHPDFTVQNLADNSGGRLDYAVVQLAPRAPANGSGVVATIHLRGVKEGSSPLRFARAKLASPDGFEIPVSLQDGSIVVNPPTSTDTPTPTHTPGGPTATPQPTTTSPPATAAPTQPSAPTATPAPTAPPPTITGCPTLFVVRTNDTAFSIARRFGISVDALAAANGLSSSYYIQIGQLLIIPGVPGPSVASHNVQAGETLYSIARRYGTSVETLAALNRLPHPWHVRRGQTLLICPP